jgi:site-specific DNA-methyltransferase (adenine-specific)/modification methylase
MELNVIHNEDCLQTIENLHLTGGGGAVDCVLTSPPYNTSRKGATDLSTHQCRYEDYNDSMTDEEYIDWTIKLFNGFDSILKKDGSVLYNVSYSSENTWMLWNMIAEIQKQTAFTVADCIVWKKSAALPNNVSQNKLTRICEFVFVFCRKSEFATFKCYKSITSTRDTGQNMYENVFNFIEAPNNDEVCPIHKATYSTLLCRKLLVLYTKEGDVVYDPFLGTGTTAIACHIEKRNWIGSEISKNYCEWARNRIKRETRQMYFDF